MVATGLAVRALLVVAAVLVNVMIDRPVVDRGQVLSTVEKDRIAQRITALRRTTEAQMAVVTIKSLGSETIERFSLRTANAWGGGSRSKDDGLLLVLAIRDRRIRLEVGAGLTDKVGSARAQELVDGAGPLLRERRYADAVLQVVEQLEPLLRPRPALAAGKRAALAGAAGAVAAAVGIKAATSRDSSAGGPAAGPLAPAAPETGLVNRGFWLAALAGLFLGALIGGWRLWQDSFSGVLGGYAGLLAVAAGAGKLGPLLFGAELSFSVAIAGVTLLHGFIGMQAALATHLRRHIGPDDDFELIETSSVGEVASALLPSGLATLALGGVLRLSALPVGAESDVAVAGALLVAVWSMLTLRRLARTASARSLPAVGSGTRVCTSRYGATDTRGVHTHDRNNVVDTDSDSSSTSDNDTDNRGGGGSFHGDGASSKW